ncbi:agamous-like MADS-box protein AGL62 [Pyrus ussuriensis x Pyrus communis]|uniref:Agamous-like MADS-box protein AGL62 n=1 Tax=Pyrus ussuriensis x Pyrus communis TaxID=2448454 RepID=A0A5N5FTV5_9ROSA|nr:agamous-like MADS-box protein AGL62 [Pyrus ussuriensis x Pyrus communis]
MARTSRGRQRVPMTKITNEASLQVTFSKRRNGLFKKASELCTLCGAEIALMVFSPGKKVFSFGHPCFETLIDRFEGRLSLAQLTMGHDMQQMLEAYRNVSLNVLSQDLTKVMVLVDNEKKLGVNISQTMKESMSENWWECPLEEIETDRLEFLKTYMEELGCKVNETRGKMLLPQVFETANDNNNFFVGSSCSNTADGPYDHMMQTHANQPSSSTGGGLNENTSTWPFSAWNPSLGGGFL